MSLITRGLGSALSLTRGLGDDADVDAPVIAAASRRRRSGGSSRRDVGPGWIRASVSLRELNIPPSLLALELASPVPGRSITARTSLRESVQHGSMHGLIDESLDHQGPAVAVVSNMWRVVTFDVNISAGDARDVSYEMCIRENDDVQHGFRGVPTPDGVVVRLPPLDGMLGCGRFAATFRVMLGDRVIDTLRFVVSIVPALDQQSSHSVRESTTRLMRACIERRLLN